MAGMTDETRRLPDMLRGALAAAPDPDLALTGLLRFAEATLAKATLFNDLARHPVLLDLLTRVCGSSQYFADILVRDPELFRWLTATDVLAGPRGERAYAAEAARIMELFPRAERRLDALRRFFRREMLHVGTRDILGTAPVEETVRSLSELADVLADTALRTAADQMAERFPKPPRTPFALIGLGKLGGRELNYSSDIDVMAVYGDEGEVADADGREITHLEYFHKLTERLVQNLSRPTAEGYLYRVDTRLRPESGAGPLARSVAGYLSYYEARGELWERQMLIKARPIAGDRVFGAEFLLKLAPFIYPRTFFESPLTSVRRMKERIEAEAGDPADIKTRAGGIRDIEFTVQALQLINGGRMPALRTGNTLEAIARLRESGALGGGEADALEGSYRLYRAVEHRLQFVLNTQTHALPADTRARARLARGLGFRDAAALDVRLAEARDSVRRVYTSVLGVHAGAGSSLGSALEAGGDEAAFRAAVEGLGFRDRSLAGKHVRTLASGSALAAGAALDQRARQAFRDVADLLMRAAAATPDPDFTLHNIVTLAAAQRFPEVFYRQLAEERTRRLIVHLASASQRLVRFLARDPLLMERLAADAGAIGTPVAAPPGDGVPLPLHREREEARLVAAHVLGLTTFDDLTSGLTALADLVVGAILAAAGRRTARMPFAVFALGKYGTGELGLDADLDLLFVTGERSAARRAAAEKAAGEFVRRVSGVGPEGRLYEIDARLRPEGRNAPLVTERSAYREYLLKRASLWERQSLTRLRYVGGDAELGEEVLGEVRAFVYGAPLPRGWAGQVVAMRKKTETRSRAHGGRLVDVKLGEGGMVDLEFLAQMALLAGRAEPGRRPARTAAVLAALPPSVLPRDVSAAAAEAYGFFRSVEFHLRSTLEERGSLLPEGPALDRLARVLQRSEGAELFRRVAEVMRESRAALLAGAGTLDGSTS